MTTAPSTNTGTAPVATVKQALAAEPPLLPHSDLDAFARTVVFAPHPDDESLGCGGLIALLRKRNKPVDVVFVSDGAMSHPNSLRYDRAARVTLREQEALAACELLGVTAEHIRFLRYPDTAVPRQHHAGFEDATNHIRSVLEELQPSHILVCWRRDPHCDHRATWELCRAAYDELAEAPKWIEYPIWMWNADQPEDLPRPGEVISWRLDVSEVQEQKQAAVKAHISQTTDLIDDDPEGFVLEDQMLNNFRRPTELYFEEPTKREQSLDADYFDGVYQASDDPWSFTTSDYERSKYEHTLASLPRERYESALEIGCSIGVLTRLLADRCDSLLSVDIAEKPLRQARKRLANHPHVRFEQMMIPREFPEEQFDLIVVSEVGYYWSPQDLEHAVAQVGQSLTKGGTLLLVHFTPYVPDYPLTGDEVHETFERLLPRDVSRQRAERRERYRLDVYQRS